jgi:putative Flp pilus-assembly TadE/G-like protein
MRQSLRHSEQGSIVVMTAVSLVMLLGMTALAIDASFLYDSRDRMGAAADAAARAAALELGRTSDAAVLTHYGQDASARLGFADGTNGVHVTVNHPPLAGPFAGDAHYVEATVSRLTPTFFLRALGTHTMTTSNRATAGGNLTPPCITVLNGGSTSGAFLASGGSQLDLAGCTVQINSTHPTKAGDCTGGAKLNGASSNSVTVNVVGSTSCTTGSYETLHTGASAVTDPFQAVAAPSFPTGACSVCSAAYPSFCTNSGWKVFGIGTNLGSGPKTLDPGIYCHGISTGTATVTMNAGVYVLYGCCTSSFAFNASTATTSVSGTDVVIYNTGASATDPTYPYGSINIQGGANVTLAAPLSGAMAGVTIFQDRSNAKQVIIHGGSAINLSGTLYARTAHLDIAASGNTAPYFFITADTVTFSGSSRLRNNIPAGLTGGIFQDTKLAE